MMRPFTGFAKAPAAILSLLAVPATLLVLLLAGAPAHAQEAYHIRPGDVLRIEVIEDTTLNRSVLVSPDGRITVPLAGAVAASGRTVEQVQANLADQLAPNFAAPPSVFVSVERIAEPRIPDAPAAAPVIEVYLLGEFAAPGKMPATPGTTVLQLFAQAKGFTRFAATKRIQLHRRQADGSVRIYPLNYDAITAGTSPNGSVLVAEGDVFVAPTRRLFE